MLGERAATRLDVARLGRAAARLDEVELAAHFVPAGGARQRARVLDAVHAGDLIANAAAGVVVGKAGTATASPAELRSLLPAAIEAART